MYYQFRAFSPYPRDYIIDPNGYIAYLNTEYDPIAMQNIIDSMLCETYPDIDSQVKNVNFGDVKINHIAQIPFTIINNCDVQLIVSSINVTDNHFWVSEQAFTIQPNSQFTIQVFFQPTETIEYSAQMIISSNDPDESEYTIQLQGKGFNPDITPTETTVPTITLTPTPTPTYTPNPTETPTLSPTPTPQLPPLGVYLYLNQTIFYAGDQFLLQVQISNPEDDIDVLLFVILDVYGNYWFYPSWSQYLDYESLFLTRQTLINKTILDFIWPQNAGSADDIKFWSAITDPSSFSLIGNYDMVSFSYR